MKRSMLLGVIAAMAASCTVQEAEVLMDERTEPVFYASFEQPEEDTKVYANEQLLIRWHEDDRLSIFNKLTYNQQYQFTGKTGDNSGSFKKVDEDVFVTGNTINDIVAVYPYQQGTSIAEDEVLSVELPGDQVYAQNTFGRGANTMVSVSSGNVLMFKNVGAYLMFSLYGEDVSVSSITLRGNNGEKLSGKAYVTMPLNGLPSAEVVGDATDASTAITLRCETPMALGASAAECTEFWFVVPPVTFSRGFTITITQSNGGTVEKSTSNTITLTRNKLSKMAPMEVEKAAAPEPEAVDLGLPSGLKWASWNVGASAPEEYGYYFAWGETEPKSNYKWSTYKFELGTDYQGPFSKYVTNSYYGAVDNKTVLDLEDDAAHANWGGSWRMPTLDECKELLNNCTWTWTTQNGVNGRKVTGPNGKSIFLPAAGDRLGTSLSYAESYGQYWSSSLCSDYTIDAYLVGFNSDNYGWGNKNRHFGQSVRPVYAEFIPVSSISVEPSSLKLKVGESYTLSATIIPFNATEKNVHWVSSNNSVATVDNGLVYAAGAGTVTITAYDSSGVSAECTVTVEAVPLSAPDDVEAVDLGLPSGLKWATCNVGASKPEQYGAYFAWGETEPKSNYSWSTYKFELGTDYRGPFSKYVTNSDYGTVDNKTVLDLEDDAAHANWGGSWRMPTLAECKELFDNCTWEWTSQNGVNGRKVTGPNGKSIFLPAAGYRIDTNLYNAGAYGHYWSSSLITDVPYDAYLVFFESGFCNWYSNYRYFGRSVRPVSGEPARPEPVRFTVAFDELSGLCLSADGDFLWAIGDNGDLAKLSIEGEVLWKSHIRGDSEAITLDPSTGDLLIGMEPNVVGVVKGPDFNGGASTLFSLSKAISYGNSGVEGITYYKDGLVYVGTQTESRLFCCELATGEVLWDKSLYNDGLVSEIAGMCYDPIADRLWIIDSEKKTLFVYTGDAETLLGSYPVAGSNPESVCVDHAHDCVWVGDDYGSISYLYRYPISELGALAQ